MDSLMPFCCENKESIHALLLDHVRNGSTNPTGTHIDNKELNYNEQQQRKKNNRQRKSSWENGKKRSKERERDGDRSLCDGTTEWKCSCCDIDFPFNITKVWYLIWFVC